MSATANTMLPTERRAVGGLALVYGLRMLGLFIVLPVFALYAAELPGGENKTLVGFALGAYGLTQAVLQIPFGWWSDRIGRKPVIYAGLAIFAIGSVVAALAANLYVMVLGRVLQGAGAISGAVLALNADLTRESVRTKAMALIGMTIGLSFVLSIVVAPVLTHWIGVSGIFWLIAVLALCGALVIALIVPTPVKAPSAQAAQQRTAYFARVLSDGQLLRLNFGIFTLHAVLTAIFLVVPFYLVDIGLLKEQHWRVYLPVMLASIAFMVPFVARANRAGGSGKLRPIFIGAIALLALAQAILAFAAGKLWVLCLGAVLFFTAFNVLEATLPSIISRVAPPEAKGTALGVYSSVQFLGPAIGASVAGALMQHHSAAAVFWFCLALSLLWLVVALSMRDLAPAREIG